MDTGKGTSNVAADIAIINLYSSGNDGPNDVSVNMKKTIHRIAATTEVVI
jgi:hypothetical protein